MNISTGKYYEARISEVIHTKTFYCFWLYKCVQYKAYKLTIYVRMSRVKERFEVNVRCSILEIKTINSP
jgi:hypothetical protein